MWPGERRLLTDHLMESVGDYLLERGYGVQRRSIRHAIDDTVDFDIPFYPDDGYAHYIPDVARLAVMYHYDLSPTVMMVLDRMGEGLFYRMARNIHPSIEREICAHFHRIHLHAEEDALRKASMVTKSLPLMEI